MSMAIEENICFCIRQQMQSGILGLYLTKRRSALCDNVEGVHLNITTEMLGALYEHKALQACRVNRNQQFSIFVFCDMISSEGRKNL